LQVYPHGHVRELRRLLERPSKCRRRLIVTDSLFSMDGDIAPLTELGELSEEFNAMLLVDEAHATGLFGERGTGLAEATWDNKGRQAPAGLVCVGTLSKALGSQGGFVVGSQRDIDWLWNSSRTQMFSTALTPASCAAALAALDIIEQEPWRRQKLAVSSQALAQKLRASGLNVAESVAGPVIPVILGDSGQVLQAARALESEGFLVGAIRPPTVPKGTSRLRISITCSYEQALTQEVARILSSKTASPTSLGKIP
jgi:7-keto-8-aminopelargonate synthetase-like enzyme